MKIQRVVIATSNPKKAAELRTLLAEAGVEVLPWPACIALPETTEDGATFAENALAKARAGARALGGTEWVLADDSGLEVDALGGRPGVHSHRYAGEPPDDDANNAKLLFELAGVPLARRTARFRCALALSRASGETVLSEGICEGRVAEAPRGIHDFGYDPVFFYPPLGKTFAELFSEEKNRVSHRAAAVAALLRLL